MSHSHDHGPTGPSNSKRQHREGQRTRRGHGTLTRRALIQEFGRRTVAVAVLGSGVATVACGSSETAATLSPAVSTVAPTAEQASATQPTAEQPTPEPTAQEVDEAAEADSLQWEQVSFGFVSAYVLARGNEFAVVDTGTPGNGAKIGSVLQMLGANLDDLDHVILTHLHGDHVGSLPELLNDAPKATAYAGAADVNGIESPRALQALNDGDDVFGLRVVATPGHTAGHICLVDEQSGVLIAGDAVVESGGSIAGAPEQFTEDLALSVASAKSLAAFDFDTMLVGHGSPIDGDAAAAFDTYLASI